MREQQIIDEAVHVFSKRGYHAASVDEIAEMAGISKPMVYLYLSSKEGLFVACIRREAERMVRAFQSAAQDVSTPELRLRAGLRAFFTFVSEHRDGWVVLHRQAAELSKNIAAEIATARQAVMAEVAGLIEVGIEESGGSARLGAEDAEFAAHALVGAADTLTDWMEAHPGETPERMTLRLMNMVWVGMRNVLDGEVWVEPGPGLAPVSGGAAEGAER